MSSTGRPTISGTRHAISAGHYLAASAGFAILEAGGNAVDAGCAAGLALGVLQPDLVSVAGVAPIMIRLADGRTESIAGLGHWPRRLPPDVFMREHGGHMPSGVRRMVVPAAPDAWIQALARHGTMRFADIAAAAIRFAADGFAVYDLLHESISIHAAEYATWPQNAAIFLPGGAPPAIGSRFVQADLARSLSYMVDQERAAGGDRLAGLEAARGEFYRGDLARAITGFVADQGGFLALDDMAEFRSRIEPVVTRPWRGHQVSVCGPWCQGPALLEALLIVERLGLEGLAHNSAEYLHRITEALKGALADREYHFTDPATGHVPLDALLSASHIASRAAAIDLSRAHPGLPEPILGQGASLPPASRAALPKVEADTSYVAVVDRWGNAFSATPSDGSWNVPVVPGTGLVVSGRGSQSRPDPKHPAGVAPGKRPRLTPNPAMVVTRDGGVMPFGTPGGDVQIQAMLQVLLNILHFGMDVQAAIEAPRMASYAFPSSFAPYEYFPGRLAVESSIPEGVRDDLAARGHEIRPWPERTWLAGSVEVVLSDPEAGLIHAGADPRRAAYAIAG
jgi:gamma-glutamyltranspeptidase/glutathione hydrolase